MDLSDSGTDGNDRESKQKVEVEGSTCSASSQCQGVSTKANNEELHGAIHCGKSQEGRRCLAVVEAAVGQSDCVSSPDNMCTRRGHKRGRCPSRLTELPESVSPPNAPRGALPRQEDLECGTEAYGKSSTAAHIDLLFRSTQQVSNQCLVSDPSLAKPVSSISRESPSENRSLEKDDRVGRSCKMLDKEGFDEKEHAAIQPFASVCSPSNINALDLQATAMREANGKRARTVRTPTQLAEQCLVDATPQSHEEQNLESISTSNIVPFVAVNGSNVPPKELRKLTEQDSWPTVTRAARLDFTGRGSIWTVSSVAVAKSPVRYAVEGDRPGAIIVCHSAGVSVWRLYRQAAVCTHLSSALGANEKSKIYFDTVAVLDGESARETTATSNDSFGAGLCIMAAGRHANDPGPPAIRVWHASWKSTRISDYEGKQAALQMPRSPDVLDATFKRKILGFSPRAARRDVRVHLCVCGYSKAPRGGVNIVDELYYGEITAVLALDHKPVRLVFAPEGKGQGKIKARTLPSAALADSGDRLTCIQRTNWRGKASGVESKRFEIIAPVCFLPMSQSVTLPVFSLPL